MMPVRRCRCQEPEPAHRAIVIAAIVVGYAIVLALKVVHWWAGE